MKNFKYTLSHSSGNLVVEYSPTNWDSFNLIFKRSKRYHSVLRSQIIDSEFPRDGKVYIDNIKNTYGIDTDITCLIEYLDKADYTYKTLFSGIIDLSEWTSARDTTSVKIADNSILSKFIARDEIKVPINRLTDLDGDTNDVYTYLNTFNVEGVDIELAALFDEDTNTINILGNKTANFTDYFGVKTSAYDVNEIGTDATLPNQLLGSASGPIYTNNSGGNIDVRYKVVTRVEGTITITGTNPWTFNLQAQTGIGGGTTSINVARSGTGASVENFDTSFNSGYVSLTLTAGQTIDLYHIYTGTVSGGDQMTANFRFRPITVEVYEVTPGLAATDVEMPLLHELGAKILEIITGLSDPLEAPLFGRTDSEPRTYGSDGDYSLSAVATGDMLRGFDFDDKPLPTSFAEYFKSLDALYNLGFWYNGTEFIMSAKADYYKDVKIIDLGEVKDFEESVSQEDYFNSIKTGYKTKLDYEEINGNQNFNVKGEFANDGKRIQNTLDLESDYRGDDYGIELSRKENLINTYSKDTKYDNEKFIITGQRSGGDYQTLQGFDDFLTILGVYSPSTRLNLNITPKRNMLRNGSVLSIPLYISNGDTNFMSNQFDLPLITNKSASPGGRVEEKEDLTYGKLDTPLYKPDEYTFNSPLTTAIILQLGTDPHGYIEFTVNGVTKQGFIKQVSTEPFNRRGNWTLLKK